MSGKVLYAKPARMPATNPPESAIAKTSAATPIAQARTDRCDAEVSVAGRGCTSESPTQSIAAKIASARPRCAVSRNCDTRGLSTSPLCTMYQPIAPCRPPSTKMPTSFHA